MEVSSHALALSRVAGCEFDVAVFTNLAPEHLEFHRTVKAYRGAKARLFEELGSSYWGLPKPGPKWGIIKAEDPCGRWLIPRTPVPVVTYGLHRGRDVQARGVRLTPDGVAYRLCSWAGEAEIRLRLPGLFNVYNSLAAAAVGLVEGLSLEQIRLALAGVAFVPGRMERIEAGQPFTVVVDYAHNPAALVQLLRAARSFTAERGRVILVFGCPGDRDPGKRPVMGEIAGRMADFAIATSDNPGSEDPERILDQVEEGLLRSGRPYERYLDRRQAIARALELAGPGDAVLLAGKGHEEYQLLRDGAVPWSDREVARELLRRLGWCGAVPADAGAAS
jgi:UDP-N-acetylmuramoyl-L-alanyl-D-glutamate--2,6-diaminopimelate ligase